MAGLPTTIWTIGHSTRTLDDLLALLAAYRIEGVADVRRFPGSRRLPHFSRDSLAITLPANGIAYERIPKLDGTILYLAGGPTDIAHCNA